MINVLVIKPGFGADRNGGIRYNLLDEDPGIIVSMPTDIPEPVRGDGMGKGLELLQNKIRSFRPDILIAGSRGGIYISELLKQADKVGRTTSSEIRIIIPPILLIGALQTKAICEADGGNHLVMMCHGTRDDRNTIDRVRVDCSMSKVAELMELDDEHALTTIDPELPSLVYKLYNRATRTDDDDTSWIEKERPKWVVSELMPKIRASEEEARDAVHTNMMRMQQRAELLSGLKKKKKQEEQK